MIVVAHRVPGINRTASATESTTNSTTRALLVIPVACLTEVVMGRGEPAELGVRDSRVEQVADLVFGQKLDLALPVGSDPTTSGPDASGRRLACGDHYAAAMAVGDSSTSVASVDGGDASRPWAELASGYEQARAREDSLDRLVEWPAQRALLGDVTGLSLLDAGCGSGAKIAELVHSGASASVGVDVSDNFIAATPPGLELLQGDLSNLAAVPGLAGRRFDRILFLQSFGYAKDPVHALQTARAMLADDGFIVLTRTQPIRYAIERAEENGTSLGEEYFSTDSFTYRHRGWDDKVALTKRPYTVSDLLNVFSAAGMWIETAVEPQMSDDVGRRHPHKQAVMNKYLGILMFKLRPLPGQRR
ncbi:MAG: methyltransferase domain-containing protein [Nocardioides sp.]|uniref:class I SAM-dependent methyltransferase n=1 Tax=Nocardioides sp. TaxID=35761 RepID=UPI0039E23161